jgi:trk system potassium uptake protein TrkA
MIAVIGLGGFGSAFCKALYAMDKEVLAVDKSNDLVTEHIPFATNAVCTDASDENVLKTLGIKNFDVVAVCVGDVESSIFITLLCKQMGVPYIIAKASSHLHKTVLEKIGANLVVFPEAQMGEKIAASIFNPTIVEIAELTPDFKIIEIITPEKWENKSLIELDIRRKHNVNIILIKSSGDNVILNPAGEQVLHKNDTLVICGGSQQIAKLRSKATVAFPDADLI